MKIIRMTALVMIFSILSGCTGIGELPFKKSLSKTQSNVTASDSHATSQESSSTSNSSDDSRTVSEDKDQMKNIDLNSKIYSDYYITKVTNYMNSNDGHDKIIFLGDSLTDMGNWNELLHNTGILNRGVSSDTTAGAFNRLCEITRLNPRKVFIMLGINDIGKGLGTDDIIINYGQILNILKSDCPDADIYVESVLPINKDIFKTSTDEKQITKLNSALAKLCGSYNVQYINLYPLFVVDKDKLNPGFTLGGLHINEKGYLLWADAIKKYCN